MKKNLLSVLILVLLIVNIALSAVMMISVTGTNKKTADLITSIATVLQIDLYSPGGIPVTEVSLADTVTYQVDNGTALTLALKLENTINEDGSVKMGNQQYIVFGISLLMNSKHDDYKQYGENIADYNSMIKDAIGSAVLDFTQAECRADFDAFRDAILRRIQSLFDSDFIYRITVTDIKYS